MEFQAISETAPSLARAACLRSAANALMARILAENEDEMRFSLKYEGPLLSGTESRVDNKNWIRWALSSQLEKLIIHADLSALNKFYPETTGVAPPNLIGGVEFIKVIDKHLPVACNLSIRIERREMPGAVLHDGDLDNRMKTLLDGLRMPKHANEVRLDRDDPSRYLCVCLLEDDSMVTTLNISTVPSLEALPRNHVKITIDVEVKPHDLIFSDDEQ